MTPKTTCPHSHTESLCREEVDIGVGTMYGPASCENCGWSESNEGADLLDCEEVDEALEIVVDTTMPPDQIELRSGPNSVRVVNIGTDELAALVAKAQGSER